MALGNAFAQAGSNVSAGAAVRRSNPIAVLLVATPVTVTVALAIAVISRNSITTPALIWGLLAGVVGGVGLILSYRAFTMGRVAVVVPVTTCAVTTVQVIAGWLLEGRPTAGTLAGAAICLVAVVVISAQRGERDAGSNPTGAVALALGAGVCFAGFVLLLAQGADDSATWSLAAARIGVLVIVLVVAVTQKSYQIAVGFTGKLAVLSALLDISANLLLLAALAAASLAVVAAVVAVAPVVAAVMAVAFLGERLQSRQLVGLGLAMVGIWIVVLV